MMVPEFQGSRVRGSRVREFHRSEFTIPRRVPLAATRTLNHETCEPTLELWLVLFDRPNLAAAVVPAVGAHAMGLLGLVTVRALGKTGGFERVVRPALRRAGL
jgi:hypothetical protein